MGRMTSKEEREEEEEGPKEKVFKSPMAKLGPLLPLQNGAMRGSFLARDADALSRLEKFNKHKEEKVGVGAKGRKQSRVHCQRSKSWTEIWTRKAEGEPYSTCF